MYKKLSVIVCLIANVKEKEVTALKQYNHRMNIEIVMTCIIKISRNILKLHPLHKTFDKFAYRCHGSDTHDQYFQKMEG